MNIFVGFVIVTFQNEGEREYESMIAIYDWLLLLQSK